ncbi:MAG: nuclear transport factor 2 family protein [Thermoanaerobaculales bacterium]|nr:nuclear transport factor 2 family protein [Thermoanaerobaculales bacterium]
MKNSTNNLKSLAAVAAIAVATLLPQTAAADENCCLNNYRFAGGCMVVASGSETCSSVQSYLNSFDSVGKYYCDNTTVRGGWTFTTCNDPANTQQQYLAPQTTSPTKRIQQNQPSIGTTPKQAAPAASDANLMQVSMPLQVQFDSDLDTDSQGAGQMVTGTLQQDLMDGDTVIAPAGSQVQAQIVPTSFWSDGSGDAYEIQATGIQVGDNVIPISGTAVQAQGEIATSGTHVAVPKGSMVSFETAAADPKDALQPTFTANGSRWMEAFNSHDAKAVAALYTTDAVLLPPNEPAVFGRDAIAATHAELFATGDFKIDIEPLETVIDGQLAYVAGRYRMWTGDGALVDHGKYIEIWSPVNGEWLIRRDIYNSSVAMVEGDDNEN